MKIYIIGAGAVGKALAVCLQQQGKHVELVRGHVEEGVPHKQKIVLQFKDGAEIQEDIQVSSLKDHDRLDGLVVLTNKSFGNKALSEKLAAKAKDLPIVLLQNGLGVEQPFLEKGFAEVYRCVLFVTCQHTDENTISYKPVAESPIGTINQNISDLKTVVDTLDTPNFRFVEETDIQRIIWKKAIANCVFNSICPLLEVDNGIFHRNEEVMSIAKRVIAECALIANKKGIDLGVYELEDQVLKISLMSDGQFISTLQDINNKRETEIDTLNFEIFRMAQALNVSDKVQETRLLGEMVKLRSELTRS
ncbi:ketopantoate reductase family protein [Flagellimonas aequoris]|uniref:2-dehydropantoate 2-reductase n=1 Tax=Flagellimonas aequoris TaxID=2306997 RepID=A0A418NB95_9FLAO|nr:2-dehydropantoate 2-reductase [Allomuricauda aequoris]RIV72863.1 2-dehydropantoate 2-reductase [Allomuricauda aequoris]TXK05369.1 2-dehydropantoate 2-reductase [Allomuricauda aequoris]